MLKEAFATKANASTMPMRSSQCLLLCLCLGWSLCPNARAQKFALTRVFKIDEGYASALSVSPRGHVIARNGELPGITWFDGFTVRNIQALEASHFRVYEGRSGQLWTLYPEGLLVFDRGSWAKYPIGAIRDELQSSPLRPFRQLSLIPAEINHAFVLLPDRLIEFDAMTKTVNSLRTASSAGVGAFSEMLEGRDGVWVSGRKGLAKIPGPIRHLSSTSVWQQFALPASAQVENLQMPFEDRAGGVTTLGYEPESLQRIIVQAQPPNWKFTPLGGEKIRQVWRGWDDSYWAYSFNSLLRIVEGPEPHITREGSFGSHYDVAVQTNGVFWLATAEGTVRYAPFIWRAPPGLPLSQGAAQALVESAEDDEGIWAATAEGLMKVGKGAATVYSWPEEFEPMLPNLDGLFLLGEKVLAAFSHQPILFDPATRSFAETPANARWKVLGPTRDGRVCVKAPSDAGGFSVLLFDGQRYETLLDGPELAKLGPELYFAGQTASGDIWLGGAGGIGLYHFSEKSLEVFQAGDGALPDRPYCFLELPDRRVWFGGARSIFEYSDRHWRTVLDGIERATSMLQDRNGHCWVSTANGVLRFNKKSWVVNDLEDGLPAASIYQLVEDRRGRIWAATLRGLSLHDPGADRDAPRTLRPSLEGGQETVYSDLPAVVQLSGIDRWQSTPAGLLSYSHRLNDGSWSAFTNASVLTLANLGAGQHRLEVRAMDRNFNEDILGAALDFTVVVPWEKDPRLVAVLVAAGLATLFFAGLAVNRHVQLLRSYAQVEKVVAQRTRELEQANLELLHSQKMRALGTLAAGIAHDFNNILSIIKGSAQIIEANVQDAEKIKTRVNRIKTVVEQGSTIVRSMLGLGRLTEKDLSWCDLGQIIEDTLKVLADRLAQEHIAVTLQKPGGLPRLLCSKELIQQMLLNFILNAVDAMSHGGQITIAAGQYKGPLEHLILAPSPAAGHLFVTVQDAGPGIAQEVLPRIFEPFYTTKVLSSRRGTGLGLSMVYEIAKGMGYGLKVESEVGKGSAFTIIFPIPAEKEASAAPAGSK